MSYIDGSDREVAEHEEKGNPHSDSASATDLSNHEQADDAHHTRPQPGANLTENADGTWDAEKSSVPNSTQNASETGGWTDKNATTGQNSSGGTSDNWLNENEETTEEQPHSGFLGDSVKVQLELDATDGAVGTVELREVEVEDEHGNRSTVSSGSPIATLSSLGDTWTGQFSFADRKVETVYLRVAETAGEDCYVLRTTWVHQIYLPKHDHQI